ncbi:MAG: hypothetical protein PHC50_04620 [Candidatus Cloacimonetes bacterium]|nr:hypothetical protein [Candidatus Cloacimonadota bacterium]
MSIVFDNVCTLGGIRQLSLEIPWETNCLLYDPTENLSRAILYCLAGLDPISSGEVYFEGTPLVRYLTQEPQLKNLCYIFDEGVMLANLTLLENLRLPIQWLNPNVDLEELNYKIHDWLARFRLALDLSKRPAAFMPGELKLFSFVRAFILDSRHYLIDNPYYALNKTERVLLYSVLREIKEKRPLLIASIDDDFDQNFADEIIDLSNFKENMLIS